MRSIYKTIYVLGFVIPVFFLISIVINFLHLRADSPPVGLTALVLLYFTGKKASERFNHKNPK